MHRIVNSNLQTVAADILIKIEPWGNELWFLAGTVLIAILALQTFINCFQWRDRLSVKAVNILNKVNSDTVFIALFTFTILILRLPGVSRLELAYGDEGGLIAGALTLLHDPRFWISVDNTTIGPVSTFSLVLIPLFGGTINYGTIKLLGIIVWILSTVLLFRAFINLYNSKIARLAVLPVVACVSTFNVWDYVAFNGEHIPVLLLSVCAYLYSKMELDNIRHTGIYTALLGITLGLLPYAKVQAAPIAAAFGVVLVLISLLEGNKKYVLLVIGGIFPTILLFIYLIVFGAFGDFWQSYILNNLIYANEGFFGETKDISLLSNVAKFPAYLLKFTDTRLYFLMQFLVVLSGTVILIFKRRSLDKGDFRIIIIGYVVVAASIYSILLPKNNWTHYLLLLIVPLTFLFGSVLGLLKQLLEKEKLLTAGSSRYLAAGVLILLTTTLPSEYVLVNKNSAFRMASENSDSGKNYTEVAKTIFKYASPGERIAVWGFAFYYEETGMAQGTREAHTERQMNEGVQKEYYINRWINDLNENNPPILLESLTKRSKHHGLEHYPDAKKNVDRAYRYITEIDGIRIYVSRNRLLELEK